MNLSKDFGAPTFEITFNNPDKAFKLNENVELSGSVKAYAGFGLDNINYDYTIVRRTYFPYRFWWASNYADNEKQIDFGEGQTDENGNFKGHVLFDSIRKIIFDPEQYDTSIEDIMLLPDYLVTTEDSAEEVVKKFERSGNYNIAVVDGKKYLGYISRALIFTTYQATLKEISDD